MVAREIGLVRVVFRPSNRIPLVGWSGSFSAKILYDVLEGVGVHIRRESVKPFMLSPLYVYGGGGWRIVWSGVCRGDSCSSVVLDPGKRYSFNIVFLNKDLVLRFIDGLTSYNSLVDLLELSYNSIRVRPRLKTVSCERVKALIRIKYLTPTHYMFRSWDILYPSHKRLLYSLGKTLYRITGVSLRTLLERIATRGMELLVDRTRTVKIKLGEDKYAYGFIGEALYGVYVKRYEYNLLQQLLWLGEKTGVGRNRSLGFGIMKSEVEEVVE